MPQKTVQNAAPDHHRSLSFRTRKYYKDRDAAERELLRQQQQEVLEADSRDSTPSKSSAGSASRRSFGSRFGSVRRVADLLRDA